MEPSARASMRFSRLGNQDDVKIFWSITQPPVSQRLSTYRSAITSWPPSEMYLNLPLASVKLYFLPSASTSFNGSEPGERIKNVG
eukprot:29072_6